MASCYLSASGCCRFGCTSLRRGLTQVLDLMWKILATLLSIFGASQAAARQPDQAPQPITSDLRSMVLNLSPAEIGLSPQTFPHQAWGVVMETGMDGGYYTLVALADGTTSLYFSTGGGVIGAGEKPEVREASRQFIGWGNRLLGSAQPTASMQPPAAGDTQFFFLTFDGVRSYAAPEIELGEERDSLSPLFHAGHAVIAAVRQAQP